MNKIFSLISILFFIASFSFPQGQIVSDLQIIINKHVMDTINVEDEETKSAYIQFYPYTINIEQKVHLLDTKIDSLVLKLEYPSPFNSILWQLFFHNMTVNEVTEAGQYPLDFSFDGECLKINTSDHTKEIIICYQFQSDYFMKMDSEQLFVFFQPQIYDWHSWFFTYPTMKLGEVKFICNDKNTLFFANNFEKKNGNYIIKTEELKNNNISFYLLNNDYYKTANIIQDSTQLCLHLSKGLLIDSLYSDASNLQQIKLSPANTTINIDVSKIRNSLINAEHVFNNNKFKTIDIADAWLEYTAEDNKKLVWGNTTKCSPNSYFILADTSLWNGQGITHEILHVFSQDENYETDSAKYFFKESLIEYMAICFYYENDEKIDSIFNQNIKLFNDLNTNAERSIFNIDSNVANRSGSGTNFIIYQKTPYIIYLFAQKIGQEKFISLLSEYYTVAQAKQRYFFSDFEKVMKKEVEKEHWQSFIKGL
ncbi:MAG: hypothetical protein ACLVKO_10045 [Dysgonomonas sp.]